MDRLASLVAFMFLTASSAWATATAPGGTGSPAGGTAATGGGIGDYWWIILVVLAAIAIWYFMRSRRNRTGL